jgi:hypothetical protein
MPQPSYSTIHAFFGMEKHGTPRVLENPIPITAANSGCKPAADPLDTCVKVNMFRKPCGHEGGRKRRQPGRNGVED